MANETARNDPERGELAERMSRPIGTLDLCAVFIGGVHFAVRACSGAG